MKYVTIKRFSEASGYSEKAIRQKIQTEAWLEGMHYRRAPDGRVLIDCEGVERWIEGGWALRPLRPRN